MRDLKEITGVAYNRQMTILDRSRLQKEGRDCEGNTMLANERMERKR